MARLLLPCLVVLSSIFPAAELQAGLVFGSGKDGDPEELGLRNLLGREFRSFTRRSWLSNVAIMKNVPKFLIDSEWKTLSIPPKELVLVWMQMSKGMLLEAKQTLERVAARYPNHPQTNLTLGQIALSELGLLMRQQFWKRQLVSVCLPIGTRNSSNVLRWLVWTRCPKSTWLKAGGWRASRRFPLP